jgi:hypothetical protein
MSNKSLIRFTFTLCKKKSVVVGEYSTNNKRKGNWIGHILRRDCLLTGVIEGQLEGRIEVTGRRGRRRKQLPDDFKEERGY